MTSVRRAVLRSTESGFTLVEVMVAMMITLVVLLGLLKSVGVITENNLRNQLRDEAVQVGERALNNLMAIGFDKSDTDVGVPQFLNYSVASNIRGIRKNYWVHATRDPITWHDPSAPGGNRATNSRLLSVRVRWMYKNISTVHQVCAIKSN